MFNYIRSELYRASHTRPAYITTLILSACLLAMNLVLHFWGNGPEWYGHTSFSYVFNVSEPFLYIIMGAVVAFVLYENHRKNGTLKNTVAYGLSRAEIFLGQCLVTLVVATVMMVVVLACWILSAELLLAHTDLWTIRDVLSSTFYVYLLAVAGLVSALSFIALFPRDITSVGVWLVVWNIAPILLRYLGRKFDLCADIASWLPNNFLSLSSVTRWWEDPALLNKALISGVVGILVFGLLGMVSCRKRDL